MRMLTNTTMAVAVIMGDGLQLRSPPKRLRCEPRFEEDNLEVRIDPEEKGDLAERRGLASQKPVLNEAQSTLLSWMLADSRSAAAEAVAHRAWEAKKQITAAMCCGCIGGVGTFFGMMYYNYFVISHGLVCSLGLGVASGPDIGWASGAVAGAAGACGAAAVSPDCCGGGYGAGAARGVVRLSWVEGRMAGELPTALSTILSSSVASAKKGVADGKVVWTAENVNVTTLLENVAPFGGDGSLFLGNSDRKLFPFTEICYNEEDSGTKLKMISRMTVPISTEDKGRKISAYHFQLECLERGGGQSGINKFHLSLLKTEYESTVAFRSPNSDLATHGEMRR